MKNKIIANMAFFLIAVFLLASCGKSYIEENQDNYSPSDVIPVVQGINGTTLALQTFSYTFELNYTRSGSTWSWSATDATISSVSDDQRKITVLFDVLPASDTALIKVVETTSAGVVSAEYVFKVKVDEFCPLAVTGFVGNWGGTDGMDLDGYYFPSEVVVSNPTATTVDVTGLNFGWIENIWGEPVIEGGTITMTVNNNGTLSIPEQYCFTTTWDGDPYDYNIVGTGTWSNCGTNPTMVIEYLISYVSDGWSMPNDWTDGAYEYFYAILELGTKGAKEFVPVMHSTDNLFPAKTKR